MLSEVIDFVKSVPDVIWSAMVASGITFFGVMLSNRSNTDRLILQLNHDANEKTKERISSLRREVYLKVAEDIELANMYIGKLAGLDLTKLDIALEFQGITASIEKLKLVAEPETAKLAVELGAAFGILFFKLLPKLTIVQEARTDIEINHNAHLSSNAEVSRMIHEMQKFNEDGRGDVVRFEDLQNYQKFFSGQAQKYADALALAHEAQQVGINEFSKVLFPEMRVLSKIQLKVMVAIRQELGIATDVAELQRQLEHQWGVMEAAFGDVMKDIKRG